MPLGLVFLQNFLYLQIERPIILRQSLTEIFMYGRFADAELLGGGADSRAVINDVCGQIAGPLFNVSLDSSPLPECSFAPFICGKSWGYAIFTPK